MKNLAYCVSLVQLDRSDYSNRSYRKYLQYAILAYKELQWKANPKVSVHYFRPNSVGLAALPPDFDFYTKVAIIIGGKAYTLSYNKNIPIPRVKCGVEYEDAVCGKALDTSFVGFFDFIPHFRAGNFVGEFYSLGGGWNDAGYFRIDYKNHQIVITGAPRGVEYCMEYVSTGAEDGGTLIPSTAVGCIRNYVHWQLSVHNYSEHPTTIKGIKSVMFDTQSRENMWREEMIKYQHLEQTPTIDEFCDLMYNSFMSSVKGVSL